MKYSTSSLFAKTKSIFREINAIFLGFYKTVEPVFSGHSKIDKTKALKTNGSIIKVESIAECYLVFCNTFDLH